jgi:cyanophycin synthetase
MSQGGITEDFTDQVGPEIKYIVESIASSIHAFVVGVDILCRDISKPLTKDNGGIIEINTKPEAYLNLYPVIGKQRENVATHISRTT